MLAKHAHKLQLLLLGPPEVRAAGNLLAFPTRKTLALLTYLALADGPQPREHLAALFWPEASPERSHASLRNTLAHLQRALRPADGQAQSPFLTITHTTLGLNLQAGIALDLQTVEHAYTAARADRASRALPAGSGGQAALQAAAGSYRGDFLAGFSLGDAPGFDDWADAQREVWRRRLGLILDRLSEIQFAGGEFAAAAETAANWIALDALNEVAYRRKMRAHFAAGERGQALETYAACRALLAAELQVAPEPATEALATRIRTQQPPQQSPTVRLPVDTAVAFLEGLFAGRGAEQRALAERFERAAAGEPQVVALRGDGGIGKTRLANEFLAWARAQGAQVLPGGAFESGSHLPFQPLVQALRGWLEHEQAPIELVGAAWLGPLAELLPELRERYPDLPPPAPEAKADRSRLFEACARLLLALASRAPLVLFIDDLQWADSATLDLLGYAIRRWQEAGARLMLLVNLRSEVVRASVGQAGGGGLIQWLAQVEHALEPTHLALEPLSERDTVQMLLACLAPPAPDFAQWLFDDTHGHPFYLMESLKDLLERGALHARRRGQGQWVFEVDADHELGKAVRVPSTVGAVVRSRLNRLSPNAFALLAAAAVLEQRLSFERLWATANLSEDAALPALDELVSSRLLVEMAPPPAGAYAFPNDMIRDVVYTEAGDARRRLFHRRALDILAAAKDPEAVLAHHALAAGLAEAAFQHSLAAGEEALRLTAAREALVHFEKARELARETALAGAGFEPRLRDLYQKLGGAYEAGDQSAQAAAVLEELERLKPKKGRRGAPL